MTGNPTNACQPKTASPAVVDEVLGYLNFSEGAADPRFRKNLNDLYAETAQAGSDRPWEALGRRLSARLGQLAAAGGVFRDPVQATTVVDLAFGPLLAAYRQFHRDLLHHQSDSSLFQPYFLARACEALLRQGSPWNERQRLIAGAIAALNDFVGYRPVAVLHTRQKVDPYAHEWVCPIPLYWPEVGVAYGRYCELIATAVELVAKAPPELLRQFWFDSQALAELALDPRAYDFDHPANKRPNFQFGQWDPHRLDAQGRYSRFVLQEVTLEAIWQRTQEPSGSPAELLLEAAAVLAGVMLMAAATSGSTPHTHDSNMTLSKLVPQIAAARDDFYGWLLGEIAGAHGERLRAEAATLRQPFGGARQYLNQRLARLRATQLQHVHLAQLFARMGYPEASKRQAEIVPVTSARMLCAMSGRLTAGQHALETGDLVHAEACLSEIRRLLDDAIGCGALVDPWNMLGFGGHYSLFPAIENSARDHRVDVLVHVVREILDLYARAIAEAAAAGATDSGDRLSSALAEFTGWWDQFATADISGVEHVSGAAARESSSQVAEALAAWHDAGEAAAAIGFWRKHVSRFRAPKAYALVVDTLLEKHDFVAARALLMHWLSQQDEIALADGPDSWHLLATRWMCELLSGGPGCQLVEDSARWTLAPSFFEHLEANAEGSWHVPQFELESSRTHNPAGEGSLDDESLADEDDEQADLYQAAYDEMTYRDTTADGVEGEVLDSGPPATDLEFDAEADRLARRLALLATFARLWRVAAAAALRQAETTSHATTLQGWAERALENRRGLLHLIDATAAYRLPPPRSTHDSLVEYDRRRSAKEHLLVRMIDTAVETAAAVRVTLAATGRDTPADELSTWQPRAIDLVRALFRGDAAAARQSFELLLPAISTEQILYIPLTRNGDPRRIVAARDLHQFLRALLIGLPRLGLLAESCQLIAAVQTMEANRPAGEGAITEFDHLFEAGYTAMIVCLVSAASAQGPPGQSAVSDTELIDALQRVTEVLLKRWLDHSRSLRLSALEKLQRDKGRWPALRTFVERWGHDLFTARFLNLGNIRAILHRGVDSYLRQLEADAEDDQPALVAALDHGVDRRETVEQLTLVLEAVAENYAEFRDFNSTTTQSDRGELLYVLLDFLTLKASYDRVAWNLRPLVLAHQVLVHERRMAAAELWRRSLAQRTSDAADWHLKRLAELVREHGVRLPTVADHLEQRFVRSLAVDRVRALVGPAVDEVRRGIPPAAFELLEQEVNEFTESPMGSGLDVPSWLLALEEEAQGALERHHDCRPWHEQQPPFPERRITWDEVQEQLKSMQ